MKPSRKLLNKARLQWSLLKLFGFYPNFRFDSFCVGVMGTVGYEAEGTIRKMNQPLAEVFLPYQPGCLWLFTHSHQSLSANIEEVIMQAGMPQGPSGNQVCLHFGHLCFQPSPVHLTHFVAVGTLSEVHFFSVIIQGRGGPSKAASEPPVGLGLMWALGSRWKEPLPVSLAVWGNCLYCCETAELWTAAMFGLEACCFKLLILHCS